MKRVCLTSEQLRRVDVPQNSSRNGSGEESGVPVLSRLTELQHPVTENTFTLSMLTEDQPMDSEGVTCPGRPGVWTRPLWLAPPPV